MMKLINRLSKLTNQLINKSFRLFSIVMSDTCEPSSFMSSLTGVSIALQDFKQTTLHDTDTTFFVLLWEFLRARRSV